MTALGPRIILTAALSSILFVTAKTEGSSRRSDSSSEDKRNVLSSPSSFTLLIMTSLDES